MEIGLGPLGSAWMGWATALADPLIPEETRSHLFTAAADTAAAHPTDWFTLAARILMALSDYTPVDDPWRNGPPYTWTESESPDNRFEWETDVLPNPTATATTLISWSFHLDSDRHTVTTTHLTAVTGIATTDADDRRQLWGSTDLAVRCLAARSRHADPLLDIRMTMIEEAWTAWISL